MLRETGPTQQLSTLRLTARAPTPVVWPEKACSKKFAKHNSCGASYMSGHSLVGVSHCSGSSFFILKC
ncbi:hypothetical protein JZ751_022591 [Albula glossodonta]|uniref:Uncharacterized protein n=1 Tax=Albula glossodonta TaxID=121402 RepID=A0A8T2PDD1_9TELE|nr:hypothetical protein JZ751_022591 [Albula glossodonta]